MEELFNEFVNEHLFKLSVGVGVAYAGVLIAMGIDFVFGPSFQPLRPASYPRTGWSR